MMLGHYENFPKNIHGIILIQYQNPTKSLQQTILFTFHRLNQETFDLDEVTPYLKQNCEVSFEFGVADGVNFNFLDKKELNQFIKSLKKTEVKSLDLFFAVCYHLVKEDGKRIPLRFDYHVLRIIFKEKKLEMRIRHERGTQRIPLDNLTEFLIKQINMELSRRQMPPLFCWTFKKATV